MRTLLVTAFLAATALTAAGCIPQITLSSPGSATPREAAQPTTPVAQNVVLAGITPHLATRTPTRQTPIVTPSLTRTPTSSPSFTPSQTPAPTATLPPAAPPADPNAPCQLGPTRTPHPDLATRSAEWGRSGTHVMDPRIDLYLTASTVRPGEELLIYAKVVDLGQPQYLFRSTDAGNPNAAIRAIFTIARLSGGNGLLEIETSTSQVIRLVAARSYGWDDAVFTVQATGIGQAEVWISASGYDSIANGAFADPVLITVTQ